MNKEKAFKIFSGLALPFFAVLPLFITGCASPDISVDVMMPSREAVNVAAINVLDIQAEANLTGNQVGKDEAKRAAALLCQLVGSRLYQEGFYQVVDGVWGAPKGAANLGEMLKKKQSQHGYATFKTESGQATGRLELSLAYELNSEKVEQKDKFELKTVPYIVDYGSEDKRPSSRADYQNIVSTIIDVKWQAWKNTGKGSLKAKVVELGTGKTVYEKTFELGAATCNSRGTPTLIGVLTGSMMPVVDEIIADISPHAETWTFRVNEDGEERSMKLLRAKAYFDAITAIEAIPEEERCAADYENLGIALGIIGEYHMAIDAYGKALELDPGLVSASDGMERIERIMEAKKKIKASDVKAMNKPKLDASQAR